MYTYFSSCNKFLACSKVFFASIMAVACQAVLAAGPYIYNAAGDEVTDIATGLVWKRCSAGQVWNGSTCIGTASIFTHELAIAHATGQASWRLPNVKELSSIVDSSRINPSIDIVAFPNTLSQVYWTSSPFAPNTTFALHVDFSKGIVKNGVFDNSGNRMNSYYVRLVR
jgi:Protein of unknown function (DUF1566)